MSFNIGLSGMRAASKDLNVTGNNIANAGTVGFKQSRAEFADVYANSMGLGGISGGSGVQLANVSQQFTQGNINYTQNALDLAINGSGFFQVSNNGAVSYTRAGYFGLDRDGNLVDNFGNNLQGFTVNADGVPMDVVGNLKIQTTSQAPQATSLVTQNFNLDSTSVRPANAGNFDPNDPLSYSSSTSTNIYDEQGNAHVMTQYFVISEDDPNQWQMHVLVDGRNPQSPGSNIVDGVDLGAQPLSIPLTFTPEGKMALDAAGPVPGTDGAASYDANGVLSLNGWQPAKQNSDGTWATNNAATGGSLDFRLDIRASTQYASSFAVNSLSQDGFTTGQMAGLEIDPSGSIFARYTNGQTKLQGQVVLASFANAQGLIPIGNSQWVQSYASGEPVRNPPGVGTMGSLQAGALEDSNVDLSDQLVNLIVAQRNYQANAKTIETESAITQTIINMR
ncbi:flagellar hook protein FlgE [Stutzerimonas tarimensis]|uniref:Flagellar hook protein FlgE n=1 Tax=Stutzerimonas tarimensis TaxID=1507735 RepID=A0ABV7T0P5_9GAMM